MSTNLTAKTLSRAIDHLCRFGDTDVFPHLIELAFISECKNQVIDELTALDLEIYSPLQALETIAPKSRYGFRIVHQSHILETILITAAVIEIAEDLEQIKIPVSKAGPFAYRFSNADDPSVFLPNHTFHSWLRWQSAKIQNDEYSHVICTDIADFYQRIYLHRIESCLETATSNKGIKRFIEKYIKSIRSRQSYGIPVGGTASRLIAEAVLADSDSALVDEGYEFTRFVDDYRIFVKHEQSVYSILAFLADQLATNEGLSLNAQKTKVHIAQEFRGYLEKELVDVFDDAGKKAMESMLHAIYFEEGVSEGDVESLRSLNLLELLREEVSKEPWDSAKIRAIFRALRLVPDQKSLPFIIENFHSLLPFVKELVLYLDELHKKFGLDLSMLKRQVLREINSGVGTSVPTIRQWLLELFVRQVLLIEHAELNAIKSTDSLDNRQVYLIRGLNGDINFFRRHKTKFEEKNNFEKMPFIIGATCLPESEFKAWIGAIKPNMGHPMQKTFCDWVKNNQGNLPDIIKRKNDLLRE